jgi:hypothetical protein
VDGSNDGIVEGAPVGTAVVTVIVGEYPGSANGTVDEPGNGITDDAMLNKPGSSGGFDGTGTEIIDSTSVVVTGGAVVPVSATGIIDSTSVVVTGGAVFDGSGTGIIDIVSGDCVVVEPDPMSKGIQADGKV